MEDRQDRTILDRIEELVAVPAGSQWTRLTLAISNDCKSNGLGVVEDSTESV